MLRKAIVFTILTFLITGCVTGPDDYLKRSANNKVFDRKGFKGSKRQPLYNKKYIVKIFKITNIIILFLNKLKKIRYQSHGES